MFWMLSEDHICLKKLANSVDFDEMPHYAIFHLRLHCLPITYLGVTSIQSVQRTSQNIIGVAPITQLRTRVIKIVTFKGGHLMW